MKLEIKHLAPYLPYQPNVLHLERNIALKVTGIYKKYNRDEHFDILLLNWDLILKSTEVKPILRPLSDLKDDSFIDINNQYPNTPNWDYYKEDWIGSGKNLSETIIEYCVMQWLIESHFDVFRLIGAGLAIDINTLDK